MVTLLCLLAVGLPALWLSHETARSKVELSVGALAFLGWAVLMRDRVPGMRVHEPTSSDWARVAVSAAVVAVLFLFPLLMVTLFD